MDQQYLKITTLEGQLLGAVSSDSFRYYNPVYQAIYCCNDRERAQYIYLNGTIYHPLWFKTEHPDIVGTYQKVRFQKITYDEYIAIRDNQNLV